MGTVRVSRGLSPNSNVMRQIRAQGAKQIHEVGLRAAHEAVKRADALVLKLYVNDRPPERRRHGRHLLGSFVGEVTSPSGVFPVVVRLRSLAPGVKVNSLNNGSRAHTITAKNAPFLVFPTSGAPATQKFGRHVYGTQAKGGKFARHKSVQHPGTKGDHFLEQALEQAVQATYHKAVHIPRR